MANSIAWALATLALLFSAEKAQAESRWQLTAIAYGWLSDLKGDINTSEGTHPVAVDLSSFEVLDHLKFAAFGGFEARKGRLILASDLTYAHIGASSGIEIRDIDLLDAEFDGTAFTATLLGGYRIAEGKVDVDLLAGARLVVSDSDLVLSGPLRTVEGDVTETWIDPIIAGQVGVPLGGRTSVNIYGDLGGGSSDFTWQGIVGVRHQVRDHWQLEAGWRYYGVDYDKGSFLYDVTQSGPILGVRFDF